MIETPVTMQAQDSAAPLLQIRGVSKQFGSTQVLHQIDLDIGRQEFICLLGPSGCGKTTLLRILSGIESAGSGSISLRGQDITQLGAEQRRFGMVFQSYALFPNLSALDNVAYGLMGMQAPAKRTRAIEMLDMVGLAGFAQRFPAQLSGGQQQRVALARAIAPQPQLLLLDEPLSALDAQVRLGLRQEIRSLQRRLRMPVVLVTHDQDEALTMADRVVLMREGRIEQQHDPIHLYSHPSTEFAARFMGRMNLWPAQVSGTNEVRIGHQQISVAHALPSSTCIHVGIRPEHVLLKQRDDAAQRQNIDLPAEHYAGIVQQCMFCGSHLIIQVRLPSMDATVEAQCVSPSHGQLPWQAGQACTVVLPQQALMVLPGAAL